MKIRIQGNSVRVRLSRGEVAQLGQGHSIQQQTVFSLDSTLGCVVAPIADLATPNASFGDATITIALPLGEVTRWASSEQVGIEGEVRIDNHNSLRLLIEKDFECLHSRIDGEDAFPNPLAQQ